MANGIVSIGTGRLRPYIGAGGGLARHGRRHFRSETVEFNGTTYETPKASENDIVLAYQAMGGIEYAFRDEHGPSSRDTGTSRPRMQTSMGLNTSYGTHNLEGGIVLFRF